MPAILIEEFDIWQPKYGGATVTVYAAGTTTPLTVYSDEALTTSVDNPQTLLSITVNGITYGKFSAPRYVGAAYELDIDGTDQTGIQRPPLTSLSGENASDAVVTTTDGTRSRALDDRFDDVIHALDYGELGATAATNDATLTAAIGAAASNGGGVVIIPDGTYEFNDLTLSAGVVLQGEGREVTTLQCETGGNCITINGDRAGLRSITLDGVSNVASGVGIFSKANDELVMDDVLIERFETGIHLKGGRDCHWSKLYVDACGTGAKLHGDNDAGGGADGDELRHIFWNGGKVSQCTSIGIDLSFEDKKCWHNTIRDVGFKDNTGTALNINGARWTKAEACWWLGNTTNLAVDDDDDTDNADINTVIGLLLAGGSMSGGAATFDNTCQDVILDNMEISDVDFTLTSMTNAILTRNCIEDASVTISGDTTAFSRWRQTQHNEAAGVTTGAAATKAWAVKLAPGQAGAIEAHVVGQQRNGENLAQYHYIGQVHRPGSTLDYDAQTANFTVGDTLTGGTSGATAVIMADSDSGTTGTLTLGNIVGEFEDNETITDDSGGSATANGVLTPQNCVIDATVTIATLNEDVAGWGAAFAVASDEIEIQVTGAASTTIDWTVRASVTLAP